MDNKYATQKPDVSLTSCAHMSHCGSIYTSHTQWNQWCGQEHWYAYISQNWHMPLKKYACHIAQICPTALLLQLTYRPQSTSHIHQKSTSCTIYLYPITKYVPATDIPFKCHKYGICWIYSTCNIQYKSQIWCCSHYNVARLTVHRWKQGWQWLLKMMVTMIMMPQPNYIYWIGHLAKWIRKNGNEGQSVESPWLSRLFSHVGNPETKILTVDDKWKCEKLTSWSIPVPWGLHPVQCALPLVSAV